jgi:hypothetical protein
MFKKNPNRPPIIVELKKIPNGYKVQSNDTYNLFLTKRVTRTMYRRNQLLIQLISFKDQILDYSLKGLPFQVLSFNLLPTLHFQHSPLGFRYNQYTLLSANFFLNFFNLKHPNSNFHLV